MTLVKVTCFCCKNKFLKELRRCNEARKFNWKFYCSKKCQSLAKTKQRSFKCGNSACKNIFTRQPSNIPISGICFCSQSCAAVVNNHNRSLKLPKNYCANLKCKKIIPRRNVYCSNTCQASLIKIPKEQYKRKIITRIQNFYKANGRIPFKKEMWGIYITARKFFGTWNNAIKAAGFEPNPVRFAKKYIANDGHRCDSLAEKIIDDWLFLKGITHETKIPYNRNRMTADFKVNGVLIEFLGLTGQLEKYDKLVKIKEKLWKEQKLKVIKIYPEDLFPKNKLSEIIKF